MTIDYEKLARGLVEGTHPPGYYGENRDGNDEQFLYDVAKTEEYLRRVASEAMAQQRRIDINIVGTMTYSQANGVGQKTVSLIDVVNAIRNQGEA